MSGWQKDFHTNDNSMNWYPVDAQSWHKTALDIALQQIGQAILWPPQPNFVWKNGLSRLQPIFFEKWVEPAQPIFFWFNFFIQIVTKRKFNPIECQSCYRIRVRSGLSLSLSLSQEPKPGSTQKNRKKKVGFGKINCPVTPGSDSVLIPRQKRIEGVCFTNIERGVSLSLPYLHRPPDPGPIQWARGDVKALRRRAPQSIWPPPVICHSGIRKFHFQD